MSVMPERKQPQEEEMDFDTVLLLERAEVGHQLIRNSQVDPFDILVAVVWPTPYAIEEQIESRRERGLSTA